MLINITNHPSKFWFPKQTQKALNLFNVIMDIDFPAIDPDISEEVLAQLAGEYAKKIKNIFELRGENSELNAVHIMGESNFCFCLVSLLLKEKIRCFASTTRRNVIYANDSTKNSTFEFVQFREYLMP